MMTQEHVLGKYNLYSSKKNWYKMGKLDELKELKKKVSKKKMDIF